MFASATADASRDVELSDLPPERLADELTELSAHIAAGMSRWLDLLGEFDARDGWWEWEGVRSCADWVAWRCAVDLRSAREHVRVARELRDLPKVREAFARGELSYSKVRAISRVADPGSEEELLSLARHATASQLERMLGAFRRLTREEAADAQARRYLHAAVQRSLENGSAEPFETQPEPYEVRNADALVAVAEAPIAGGPRPLSGPERHQVLLHLDIDALAHDAGGRLHLRDGPTLSAETARRLACDASVTSLLEANGEPLSVGRRTRVVPTAVRRALETRDRGCRFPGCHNHRWVDAHHIRHWAHGGETSAENLILLCRRHHRLLHEGGYTVERRPDGELVFCHPRGWAIEHSPRPPRGDLAAIPPPEGALFTGTGERMDLAACVDAVFAACRPTEP